MILLVDTRPDRGTSPQCAITGLCASRRSHDRELQGLAHADAHRPAGDPHVVVRVDGSSPERQGRGRHRREQRHRARGDEGTRRGRRARRRRARARRPASTASTGSPASRSISRNPARRVSSSNGRSTSTAGSTCSSTTSAPFRLRLDGFLEVTDDDFEWAMQLNFFTALRATRAALAPMVAQGHGCHRQRRVRQRVLPT